MPYQLLAADMDGTLLNAQKQISPPDAAAVNRALSLGKVVVFATGRCPGELRPFFPLFPRMRYVLCESGALVYDRLEERVLHRQSFSDALVDTLSRRLAGRDIMPQILLDGEAVMNRDDVDHLAHFQMAHYEEHFRANGVLVDDVWAYRSRRGGAVDKLCLYHTTAQEREQTRHALRDLNLTVADAEQTSLELSPLGVSKGRGLRLLCEHLRIPLEETIAIGDSYNDLELLSTAGLALCVGNAVEAVRAVSAAQVADNDHCGVAEAVERFLLSEV